VYPLLQAVNLSVDIISVVPMVVVGFVACVLTLILVTMAHVNLPILHRQPPVNLFVLMGNVVQMDVVVLVIVLMAQPALMALAQHRRLQQPVTLFALTVNVALMVAVGNVTAPMAQPAPMALAFPLLQSLLMLEQKVLLLLLLVLAC
jgi:hypothetical protein